MERVVPVHVEVAAQIGREPHDVLIANQIPLVAQPGEGGVEVDGVPQGDAVQDQPERPELVLHPFVVGAAQIPAAAVEERADAARNRLRVLAAAERLFGERGVAGVTMDDVAAAAGVGKGTLYRRFTDKGGLAIALLDERERELQQLILTGPPPLGPGADPADRLASFVAGYLAFLDRQLDLVLLSQTATVGARLRTGAHAFWRQHCRYLLSETGAPEPDLRADLPAAQPAHHLERVAGDAGAVEHTLGQAQQADMAQQLMQRGQWRQVVFDLGGSIQRVPVRSLLLDLPHQHPGQPAAGGELTPSPIKPNSSATLGGTCPTMSRTTRSVAA